MEFWKPIPGYYGYEASSEGRIRSLTRVTDRGRKWRGKILTPSTLANGYLTVSVWIEGQQRTPLVHRLVLMAFEGLPSGGAEALHADGARSNNRPENLSWGTHSENQMDTVRHGTHRNASKDECPVGHPYDEDNTYIYPGRPHRGCRECRRIHSRNTAARKKAA